jgi:hypothetical protein
MARKKKTSMWEDDCDICVAMQFAEENGRMPTIKEFQVAFEQAAKRLGPERAGITEIDPRTGKRYNL